MTGNVKNGGLLPGIAMGVGVSLLICVIGGLVCAWMVGAGRLEEGMVGYAAMIIWLLSAFGGSILAGTTVRDKLLVVCLLTGLVFYVVLILINFGFYGGEMEGMLPALGVILGGSGGAGLILSRPARPKHKTRRIKRTG